MVDQSTQFAVRMLQVVFALPGSCGVPVIGVSISVAVSALRQAFFGGEEMAVLL